MDILTLSTVLICIFTVVYLYYFYFKKSCIAETEEFLNDVLDTFQPEPLYTDVTNDETLTYNIATSKIGIKTKINDTVMLNFASSNYLNLVGSSNIEQIAAETIYKYGVGSCGPRGFYGTVDVHLELENRIAKFMKMEEAVVYSYGFSTVASAIPAYCKRTDVIFCDEKISFAAQKGMDAARCKVYYFKHNDALDLEMQLQEFSKRNSCNEMSIRKFLVLEGIYMNTGNICDLPSFVELRSKYKMRLFIDESLSIGVLGKTGRGIIEHHNINPTEIDLIVGSLEGLIGSIGGFCVGTHFIIEHQHLSGLGYCFSASLPPVLTRAAICAFDYLDNKSPHVFRKLREKCEEVHCILQKLPNVKVIGDKVSPLKYLKLLNNDDVINNRTYYDQFIEECHRSGLMICSNYDSNDFRIKVTVNIDFTIEDITLAFSIMLKAIAEISKNF